MHSYSSVLSTHNRLSELLCYSPGLMANARNICIAKHHASVVVDNDDCVHAATQQDARIYLTERAGSINSRSDLAVRSQRRMPCCYNGCRTALVLRKMATR